MSDDSSITKKRRRRTALVIAFAAAVILAIPVGFIVNFSVTQAIGRVTTVTEADGNSRDVYWRDYPGIAGLDAADVLDGPYVEEALVSAETMIADIEDALSSEVGLEWKTSAPDPAHLVEGVQNWYGGDSMLTTINGPQSMSTSAPAAWEDKERAIATLTAVAEAHGFGDLAFDHDSEYVTEEARIQDFGGSTLETRVVISGTLIGQTGQWLTFTLHDLRNDTERRFADDWAQRSGVSLMYGANGLLPEADRAEFEHRLEPFEGLAPPAPLET